MSRAGGLIDAIGETPLIRLNQLSDATGCEILGKAEFMNPGGSVKDRAALGMVRAAEADGTLQPGGTIVEGTAGNTGIGLAMVGNALGYKTIIVMPNTQSAEKVETLAAYGPEIRQIPAVPFKNPAHFVHESGRIAAAINNEQSGSAFWANQFDNTANRDTHRQTTAEEIWRQTEGSVDGFVCAVGTGGTLAGVAAGLRAHNPDVHIGLCDPEGSGLHHYFEHGAIKIIGSSISEGIGNSRVTENLAGTKIDFSCQIPDTEALPIVYELIRSDGLLLGGSSGINIAGAMRMAQRLGPGHTIVTILCDSGLRYKAKLFNKAFLTGRGITLPDWLDSDAF
ncbi:MAG: cysteine synthase A [Pseudomonadota bacterium]